jgi:hypothetical protein
MRSNKSARRQLTVEPPKCSRHGKGQLTSVEYDVDIDVDLAELRLRPSMISGSERRQWQGKAPTYTNRQLGRVQTEQHIDIGLPLTPCLSASHTRLIILQTQILRWLACHTSPLNKHRAAVTSSFCTCVTRSIMVCWVTRAARGAGRPEGLYSKLVVPLYRQPPAAGTSASSYSQPYHDAHRFATMTRTSTFALLQPATTFDACCDRAVLLRHVGQCHASLLVEMTMTLDLLPPG